MKKKPALRRYTHPSWALIALPVPYALALLAAVILCLRIDVIPTAYLGLLPVAGIALYLVLYAHRCRDTRNGTAPTMVAVFLPLAAVACALCAVLGQTLSRTVSPVWWGVAPVIGAALTLSVLLPVGGNRVNCALRCVCAASFVACAAVGILALCTAPSQATGDVIEQALGKIAYLLFIAVPYLFPTALSAALLLLTARPLPPKTV